MAAFRKILIERGGALRAVREAFGVQKPRVVVQALHNFLRAGDLAPAAAELHFFEHEARRRSWSDGRVTFDVRPLQT